MGDDPNSADREFLRLVGEGREEEARQYVVEHLGNLSEDVREDAIASLSDEGLELEVLKQEEELRRKRRAG